ADSWYARLAPLMAGEAMADPIWGERRQWGERAPPIEARGQAELPIPPAQPAWATRPVGPEPRPPRPLAPSSAGEDYASDPPLAPGTAAEAAQRGVLIHRLLERLPEVAPGEREERARVWLARNAAGLRDEDRAEILARALD